MQLALIKGRISKLTTTLKIFYNFQNINEFNFIFRPNLQNIKTGIVNHNLGLGRMFSQTLTLQLTPPHHSRWLSDSSPRNRLVHWPSHFVNLIINIFDTIPRLVFLTVVPYRSCHEVAEEVLEECERKGRFGMWLGMSN